MKISVLTPTYNDGCSLKETLQSLVKQTYKDWEWIVINDGSTDDTDEIIQNLIKEYQLENQCIYIKQENGDQLNALINGSNHITGDYVFILHSDDLLPSDTFFQQCVDEMVRKPELDGLIGDLVIINEKSEMTGVQKVREYRQSEDIPPLMLLWLGRNVYVDVAFHKKEIFLGYIKQNYLTWNMPFWLYYKEKPQMVNYQQCKFPMLKYRVHEGNYANSELGLHNVLNGELRTAIRLLHYYYIPNYKYQYMMYRFLNKLRFAKLFRLRFTLNETENKSEIIDFIIKKRFVNYEDKIYFHSIYQFYKNKRNRVLDMSCFPKNTEIYCGKDSRIFNRKLFNNTLDVHYIWFMKEMCKGFDKVSNYEHLGIEKMGQILEFFCIEKEVEL